MTAKITSKEVLLYLNYLGYNNVNAQQLKEFVQDLKKLIKYEERKKSAEDVHIDPPNGTSNYLSTKHGKSKQYVMTDRSGNGMEGSTSLNLLDKTLASKTKMNLKKDSVISLQIKKRKSHSKDNQETKELQHETRSLKTNNSSTMGHDNKKHGSLQTRSSFIRPSIQVNNKSDPVALYHHYKVEWERHKVPGENRRTELRWAIREKMLSGPKVSRT